MAVGGKRRRLGGWRPTSECAGSGEKSCVETGEGACRAIGVRWISEESREWGEAPRQRVGALEREGRRSLAVGLGRPEAGVGGGTSGGGRTPRVKEPCRRRKWRSHAWGNGEAGSRVTGLGVRGRRLARDRGRGGLDGRQRSCRGTPSWSWPHSHDGSRRRGWLPAERSAR